MEPFLIDVNPADAEEPLAVEPRGRGVHLRARRHDRDRVRQGPPRARGRATASTTTRSCRTRCARTATCPPASSPSSTRRPRGGARCSCTPTSPSAQYFEQHGRRAARPRLHRLPRPRPALDATPSSTSASTSSPRACSPSAWSKGDHLGIWARNVPDWLTFAFATAKIGVVLVTVNPVYKSHELAYVIKQSDMKALAIIDAFRDVDYVADRARARPRVDDAGARPPRLAPSSRSSRPSSTWVPRSTAASTRCPSCSFLGEHGDDEALRARRARAQTPTTSSTCSTPRARPASPRASCSRTATSSTTASTSASARSSRPRTASACRCRSSTASASCSACSPCSRTARRS